MTQEHKNILLKDLCARLPYGVKIQESTLWYEGGKEIWKYRDIDLSITNINRISIDFIKPYLFPLESMTEEQSLELEIITGDSIGFDAYALHDFTGYSEISLSRTLEIIQWCYANHFDINGLIPIGLANDATGLNIY